MSGIWCFESEQFLVINKRVMNPACERKSYYDYEEDTLRNSIKELKNYKVKKKKKCCVEIILFSCCPIIMILNNDSSSSCWK